MDATEVEDRSPSRARRPVVGRARDPERPGRELRTAFAAFAVFTGFAGDFWRNLTTWYGFGFVVLLILVAAIVLLVRARPPLRWTHLPAPLVLFVGWCGFSVIWSAYRIETLLGFGIQLVTAFIALTIAVTLSKQQFLTALSRGLRAVLGLSLLFELVVAIFFPNGVLPVYMLQPGVLDGLTGVQGSTIETAPAGFQWSQGNLFRNAAIQGIVGNRNLLAMIALLCLVVIGVQWAAGRIARWNAIVWLVVAVAVLGLSRGMTAIAAAAVVAFAVLLIRIARPLTNGQRWVMYAVVGFLMIIGSTFVIVFNNDLFALVNRTPDLSGRGDIWSKVTEIATDHWILGVGWISYWAPWIPLYANLQQVAGITYLQAHNAYLDAWMQTGVIGAALLIALVFSTLVRTWWLAIDRPQRDATGSRRIPNSAVLAFLVMVALAVQSLTESRLLIEGNWMLLCYFAIYSKLRMQDLPALPRRSHATRTGPITAHDRHSSPGVARS